MYRPFDKFRPEGRLISVIGSGGKTTFLRWLSERLSGTVILTTSTHIRPFPEIPLVNASPENREQVLSELRDALARSRVVCLGNPEPSGKLADSSPVVPFETLLDEADHVLVEADGAKGLPLKAHRPWEPVIPGCSDLTVCLVGASGIGKPVSEACHCPDGRGHVKRLSRFYAMEWTGRDVPGIVSAGSDTVDAGCKAILV